MNSASVAATRPKGKRKPHLTMKPCPVKIPEKLRQRAGVYVLRLHGYRVNECGQFKARVRCPNAKCGQSFFPPGGYGNDAGTPDAFVTHDTRWPGVWCAMDFKTPQTTRRPEQIAMVEFGPCWKRRSGWG